MSLNPFTWIKWPQRKKLYYVTIYMKSGNVIHLYDIAACDVEWRGDEITRFSIKVGDEDNWIPRLMVQSIALSQVEAITSQRTQ